ncbi:MAG TPA: hypothetical protein VIY48_11980 [Candidatus Paceibacterota bacterium]
MRGNDAAVIIVLTRFLVRVAKPGLMLPTFLFLGSFTCSLVPFLFGSQPLPVVSQAIV